MTMNLWSQTINFSCVAVEVAVAGAKAGAMKIAESAPRASNLDWDWTWFGPGSLAAALDHDR